MKRYILLFFGIILVGGLAIFMPSFLSSRSEEKEVAEKVNYQKQKIELMNEISSNIESIDSPETVQSIPELYDPNQMFFLGIENLYDYLYFNQVEDVKQRVQFYVHNNIDEQLLDCELDVSSIVKKDNIISFNLLMEGVKSFSVVVTVNEEGQVTDISLLHSLN